MKDNEVMKIGGALSLDVAIEQSDACPIPSEREGLEGGMLFFSHQVSETLLDSFETGK